MKKHKKSKKNKRKILFIILLLLLILFIGIFYFYNYKKNNIKVILNDNLEVEINTDAKLLSFIKEVENGEIVSLDNDIDTSKLGKKKLEVEIKNKDDKIEKFKFYVNIIDTTIPVIEASKEITINLEDEVDLLSFAKVSDNSLEDIKLEVQGEYKLNEVGQYKLKYYAKDSSNNEAFYDFVLNVVDDPNNRSFTTSNGYLAKVVDGVTYIDGTLIVNKTYSLPKDYGDGLEDNTNSAFSKMKSDASKNGLTLYIASGYRSYSVQDTLYNNYVARDGKKNADTYSARAGYSEHQSGLAFDLNSIDSSFENTKEGQWVNNNCYKYGLIIRYPKGKENITGYMYEPWHLRYVGVDLATKLYNNGNWITLEEYYGIDSKYK